MSRLEPRTTFARMIDAGLLKDGDVTLVTQIIWDHGLVSLMIARPGYLLSDRRALVEAAIDTLMMGLRPSSARTI